MTDDQFNAWLADPNVRRIVLVEADVRAAGVETTRHLSTGGYVSGPADVPPNQHYLPVLNKDALQTTEALSLTGEASMAVGNVEISNPSGEYDSWLLDVWSNRPIKVFLGSPGWSRADFRLVFNGVVADIGNKSRDTLNLKVRDKLQRLNTAVTEAKLGGTTTNKDAVIPMTFGEVHNITPLLADPTTLEYQVHGAAIEQIIEVRDNGVPVEATPDLANGKFKLAASPAGAITVSVQGDKADGVYCNTVASLVKRLVTGFGKAADRFTNADIDAASFAAFDAAHPHPVGLPLPDRTNVIPACQQLTGSVGAQMVMSRAGLLRLLQVDLENLAPTFDICPHHMLERDLAPVSREEAVAAVKLGFCKNWTVQAGLQTTLSAADKELFETEWLTSTQMDEATRDAYRLSADPVQEDTLLLRRVDADAEALRRVQLRKKPRTVYQFQAFAELFQLSLGQHVRLFHPRFNLAAGAPGMVVSLSTKWASNRVTIGVLV